MQSRKAILEADAAGSSALDSSEPGAAWSGNLCEPGDVLVLLAQEIRRLRGVNDVDPVLRAKTISALCATALAAMGRQMEERVRLMELGGGDLGSEAA